ncbi:MAG: hypothetical protein V2G42_01325 [bacterium JZ-2024 1]
MKNARYALCVIATICLVFGQPQPHRPTPYPPRFPLEVGAYALYRVSKNRIKEFRGTSQELESRELTMRVAIVEKEIRKERRRRKKEQVYYWVEFDVGEGNIPKSWQKLLLLVHEDDLKVSHVLDGAREYIFQRGEDAPIYTSIDMSRDRRLLDPFRMLDPDLPLKVEVTGSEPYSADENAPPARVVRFSGEIALKPQVTDIKTVHRRVNGRAKTADDIPFNILRLEYTEETTEMYEKSPYPSKTIVAVTLALLESGNNAKKWITTKPTEMKATEK